jgi:hypothetical protein
MKQEAVDALLGELEAIRGVVRLAHIKIWALERILQAFPEVYTSYLQKLQDTEQDPKSIFPLDHLATLRKELLQDQE